MYEWIPVTEMLPELNGDYITAIQFEDGDVLVDISFWFDRSWTNPSFENVNVTHWMPLPRPPKEATNV